VSVTSDRGARIAGRTGGARDRRGTIFVERAPVIAHEAHAAEQHVLRVHAPKLAAAARPGTFAHIRCDAALAMRRPMSVMRADPEAGWAEFLFKVTGRGTALLARRAVGETLEVLGPIGRPFEPDPGRPRPLLVGGGVGIPPMVFLADRLRRDPRLEPLVLMGSEIPFPFVPRAARCGVPALPPAASAAMPLLDDWGVASRLASRAGLEGCFPGHVTDLARAWLEALPAAERGRGALYACGPGPMLVASARVAAEFDLPCQVCLEEYMACAVGGCAGCTVRVETPAGPAMQRVCVDGPVFDARAVYPGAGWRRASGG